MAESKGGESSSVARDEVVVECAGLTKAFGATQAVDGVDLTVARGELVALLGPSGCGKTTTLRLIAGFERPDAGTVSLAGESVAGADRFVPAERRRVGVVFQDYALFPHMTVAKNVGYGVRDASRRADRVAEMLALVGLVGTEARLPHELSGGQQQRVALARALAPEPAVLLLDEPFSNLDAALRARVRGEVRSILRAADVTTVFVTHDQEEALSLADRVAVMNEGKILQIGVPRDLYEHPSDRFVAGFVGDADVISGDATGGTVATLVGTLPLDAPVAAGRCEVVIRPEAVELRLENGADASDEPGADASDAGIGVVESTIYYGRDRLVVVALADGTVLRARVGSRDVFEAGDRVSVAVKGPVAAFQV